MFLVTELIFNFLLIYCLLKRNKTETIVQNSTSCVKNTLHVHTQVLVWIWETVKVHHNDILLGLLLLVFMEYLFWAYYKCFFTVQCYATWTRILTLDFHFFKSVLDICGQIFQVLPKKFLVKQIGAHWDSILFR